ncbi:MAG TPA: hypothetical protein VGS61_07805 [Acidimicrobiales bacterium]|nr:hypothetical protein [Acidimicrobiales bacterium]
MRGRARRLAPVALALAAGVTLAGCTVAVTPTVTGRPSTSINVPLQSAACTTRDVCAAFGTATLFGSPASTGEFRRASGSWAPLRTPSAVGAYLAEAEACAATFCLIGGASTHADLVWRFSTSPPRVTALTPPPGGAGVDAAACTKAWCALVDSPGPGSAPPRFVTTADAGATWSVRDTIPVTGGWRTTALACPSTSTCLLVLVTGQPATTPADGVILLETTDGGSTWSPRDIPSLWVGISALSCGPDFCDAIVSSARGTLWARSGRDGRDWRTRRVAASVNSMACTTRNRCVLVGTTSRGPWAATTNGRSLTVARLRYVPSALTSAACGSSQCALINNSTVAAVRP